MFKKNEFKFSTLRQFGSENVSFTSTLYSYRKTLSESMIKKQIMQIHKLITSAFVQVQEREIGEKELLIEASTRRREAVKKYDESLKEEMQVKKEAGKTLEEAKKISNNITKK